MFDVLHRRLAGDSFQSGNESEVLASSGSQLINVNGRGERCIHGMNRPEYCLDVVAGGDLCDSMSISVCRIWYSSSVCWPGVNTALWSGHSTFQLIKCTGRDGCIHLRDAE